MHKGRYFVSVNPVSVHPALERPERFVDRLCFSTVDRYFNSPIKRSKAFVIARNPATFICACGDDSSLNGKEPNGREPNGRDLKQALPRDVYEGIDATTAVTKWAGEAMDLSMAIDGLLGAGRA